VDAEIAALSQGLPSGEAAELVGKFREAHGVMGRRYREAYEKFTAAGFASSVGDAAVRGVDRVPTETLRQAITALDKLKEQADLQGELGVRQAKWLAGGLMLAGLIGAGLVSLGVSKKAVSPVGS
jgi:methyl-accepting chemotaxis protein-1 (serine sensor receptor)